jgi:hypothetical protein
MSLRYIWVGLLVFLSQSSALALNSDTSTNKYQIKVETGYYNSVFLKHNGDRCFNPANMSVLLKYLGQIRGNCIINDKYYLCFEYKQYAYSNYATMSFEPGTLLYRDFHAFNLDLGLNLNKRYSKIKVYSYLNFCARNKGGEIVLVAPGIYGNLHLAPRNSYLYQSVGTGAGTAASIVLLNHLSITLDLRYNYFFESKNTGNRYVYSTDQFKENEYRVNRQMISSSINVGYTFKLQKQKFRNK